MKIVKYSNLVLGLILAQPATLLMAQQQPQPWENQGSAPAFQQQQQQQQFGQEQLTALVAPIALYPDSLLSQVLVAATYPMELQQAAQWRQANGNLSGQDLVAAASQQPWDASVQALVVFPDALYRLSSNIQWATDLGNAFLAQQGDVMNAVQILRSQARNSGRLTSTAQQNVIYQDQGPQSAIEIQPADPETVYVPNYNPEYIWGVPAYGYDYPALYYPRTGFGFGFGVAIGQFFGGLGWGSWGWHPNWYGRTVVQNNYFVSRYRFNGGYGGSRYYGSGSANWAHNPEHRQGVPYAGRRTASYGYGGNSGGRYQQSAGPRYNGGGSYNAGRGSSAQAAPFYNGGGRSGSYQSTGTGNSGRSYQQNASPYSGGRSSAYQSTAPGNGGRSYSNGTSSYGGRSSNQQSVSPYNGGRSARSYQSSSAPATGSYAGTARSMPNNYRQQYQSSQGNSGGGRATPSYRQQQQSSSGGSNYQASPRNFSGGNNTPSSRQQSSSTGASSNDHRRHGR